jgi:hypothetical protein
MSETSNNPANNWWKRDPNRLSRRDLHEIREIVMTAVQDAVDAITAEIGTAQANIVAEITALQATIDAGGTPDLTALQAAADALSAVPGTPPVDPNAPTS